MTSRRILVFALALAAGALAPRLCTGAEQPGPTRGDSATYDLAGVPGREAVVVWVDFAPGSAEKPHMHNAELFGFVVEGTMTFEAEGGEKRTVKAGGMFHVLPRQVHRAVNDSGAPARLAVVFVAEKGKPFTEPAK